MTAALRLGFPDPFPPFCWAEGGCTRGQFIGAIQAVTAHLPEDLPIAWVPGNLASLPVQLAAGHIDAIAAKAVIRARGGRFTFSEPLIQTAAALFARTGQHAPAPAQAGNATIATPAEGPLQGVLLREAPRARLILTTDYEDTLAALLSGRADFAALNADAGGALARRLHPGRLVPPGPRFAPLGLSVATMPGDPENVLGRLRLKRLHLA